MSLQSQAFSWKPSNETPESQVFSPNPIALTFQFQAASVSVFKYFKYGACVNKRLGIDYQILPYM